VTFEELEPGLEITPVVRGPMTTMHLMRWSAAIENWHRIHYDLPFAVEHDKNAGLLVNGSWKQHLICQMLKDWAGPEGWVWKVRFQYRGADLAGDTITADGRVAAKREEQGLGFIDCEVKLSNQRGVVSTEGTAVVVLPLAGGRRVPYPFEESAS
jgi:acyl dehydratase